MDSKSAFIYSKSSFHWLTPAYDIAGDNEKFARVKGIDHDGVEIEAFAEHPEKITDSKIFTQNMEGLTPAL